MLLSNTDCVMADTLLCHEVIFFMYILNLNGNEKYKPLFYNNKAIDFNQYTHGHPKD